jgi:hypothetical protein
MDCYRDACWVHGLGPDEEWAAECFRHWRTPYEAARLQLARQEPAGHKPARQKPAAA